MIEPKRTALRFVDDAVEREYAGWSAEKAAPIIRMGVIATVVTYCIGLIALVLGRPPGWIPVAATSVCGVFPVCGAGLLLTYRPAALRWLAWYAAFLNTLTGLHVVWLTLAVFGRTDIALGAVEIPVYFATTVFRIPTRIAVFSGAVYVGAMEIALFRFFEGGGIPAQIAPLVMALPAMAYVSGMLICVIAERTSRDSFVQEKTIESQRATIERLLKQEISHQVAERSRALSETLAKVEVALPGVRLEPGRQFADRYVVKRELGKGGMGAVFEVERVTDAQRFALKVVTGNVTGAQAARFAREAEIGARLRHPNLVPIVDVGVSASGVPYLVMELIAGNSLEDHRGSFGDARWARPVLAQIAAGLQALHDAGVVHRDLKPGNVLLSGALARISDFGISRFGALASDNVDPLGETAAPSVGLKGQSLTKTGALIGTPLYMAPEAARGGQAVEKPADIFAFGLIAYELLSGRLPFARPPVMEVMDGRALAKPAPLGGHDVVLACLETDPARRPTAGELVTSFRS